MSTVIKKNFTEEREAEILRSAICREGSAEDFALFVQVCKKTGLDPFAKQIFPVFRWSAEAKKKVMTIQTSIDGYRVIAERTGNYAPGKEVVFTYDESNELRSATAYVKKLTRDGTWHEISATAFWEEYAQITKEGKLTQFWAKMPHVMLSKCAESIALRKAFPAELSGLYTQEEMQNSIAVENEAMNSITLSQEQVDQILELVGEDIDLLDRIQKGYGVKSLYDIRAKDFDPICNRLKKRTEVRA